MNETTHTASTAGEVFDTSAETQRPTHSNGVAYWLAALVA